MFLKGKTGEIELKRKYLIYLLFKINLIFYLQNSKSQLLTLNVWIRQVISILHVHRTNFRQLKNGHKKSLSTQYYTSRKSSRMMQQIVTVSWMKMNKYPKKEILTLLPTIAGLSLKIHRLLHTCHKSTTITKN